MSDERRYDESEVAEIFEAATRESTSRARALSSGQGLTLSELQSIGQEVGVAPDRIAEAAAAVDLRGVALPQRRWLGMPLSVGRIVDLPRAPDDREWELLVAEIRETFGARGKLSSHGNLREWTNGNLHVYVEPTAGDGFRLRLRTLKGNALQFGGMGLAMMTLALVLAVVMVLTGRLADGFFAPIFLGALGAAGTAASALSLPSWARRREAQMEYLGGLALELLGPGTAPEPEEG
jgi:hypothetical protein